MSDFICCICGHFVAIETKASVKNKPTLLQKEFLKNVELAKGATCVIYNDALLAKFKQTVDNLMTIYKDNETT